MSIDNATKEDWNNAYQNSIKRISDHEEMAGIIKKLKDCPPEHIASELIQAGFQKVPFFLQEQSE